MSPQIYFTSDLHFFHKSILKHCPDRQNVCNAQNEEDIVSWNLWAIDKWNTTVNKKDIIYILGDLSFASPDVTRKLLEKLHGKKFLILGNHDKSSEHFENYFEQITQQKLVTFKKSNFDFLEEDFSVFLCHYPMVTWNSKHFGVCQAHGHCHGRLDDYNANSTDLRVDVGIDGKLGNFNFITLEQLYKHFKDKSNGEKFRHYACEMKNKNEMII